MLLEVLFAWADHLGSNHLVASLLETRDDVADQSSLDAIWLDRDETSPALASYPGSLGFRDRTFAR